MEIEINQGATKIGTAEYAYTWGTRFLQSRTPKEIKILFQELLTHL